MDFGSFIEGPLLRIVFLIFCIGILVRTAFFISSIIKSGRDIEGKVGYISVIFARFLVPFHRAVPKKPLYASLRYIFHICLFVVPIWLGGHISLWEESRFEWSWSALPDLWADWMTLLFLALIIFFIIRHITIKDLRDNSSFLDYLFITIAALPFATGYLLAHGTLDEIPFFAENMWTIHILCSEIMIITAVFLFCRTLMNRRKCTGCASCVLSCPTGTLESEDTGNLRLFNYSHYQCICCGSCVNTCPENAAELRHEISLMRFFQIFKKQEIRAVELESCNRCGALFVPEPLMEKIQRTFADEYLEFCPNCRKENLGDYLKQLSPWHRKPKHPV
ncbi:4Fe-4S dicluster domain-containing protein [Thermodesulfobacteriota bacterium]